MPDACRTNCVLPNCGNGVIDTGEQCDNGPQNSDTEPDACRTSCALPCCGDSVMDTGEQCDNGSENSDTEPDACRTSCVLPSCGDGAVDTGEVCDDGNLINGDGCSAQCVAFPIPIDPDGWTCFEEDLTTCSPCTQCNCIVGDTVGTCDAHATDYSVSPPDSLKVVTGSTGYCGYGGLSQTVTIPDATQVQLHFWTRAECAFWASQAGVVLNDYNTRTWLKSYNREEGPWEEQLVDVSAWAGQSVVIEVVVTDSSLDWCDMSDHVYSIWADDFFLTQ